MPIKKRFVVLLVLMLVSILGFVVLSLQMGIIDVRFQDLLNIFSPSKLERNQYIAIWQIRLPRLLLGLLAGSALGVSGVLLQMVLNNSLAGPNLLGVSSGASFLAALTIVFGVQINTHLLPFLSFIGGGVSGLIFLFIVRWNRNPVYMLLIGISISSLFSALTLACISIAQPYQVSMLYHFLVGNLSNQYWPELRMLFPWILVGLLLSMLITRELNIVTLGYDVATSLGVPVFMFRLFVMFICNVMIAAIVAACGPIGFIDLLSPNLVRRILKTNDARKLLPASGLMGALILVAADLFAREVFSPIESPVGIWTIMLGAPLLLVMLRERQRGGA